MAVDTVLSSVGAIVDTLVMLNWSEQDEFYGNESEVSVPAANTAAIDADTEIDHQAAPAVAGARPTISFSEIQTEIRIVIM